MKYEIIIPSNNSTLAQQTLNCVKGFPVKVFKGDNYPSYAKLINDCILSAEEEIVIILNHKIRATAIDIWKMVDLLHRGYGLVCLRNFYFYGFKKDLIRKVGFFDERYIGGGCEDSDFINRLIENNIGWYDSTETPVVQLKSTWNSIKALEFHYQKWDVLTRLKQDEIYNYNIGEYKETKFLDLSHTILSKTNQDYFNYINFKFK